MNVGVVYVPRASVTMPARAAPSVALIAAVALNTTVRLRVPALHDLQCEGWRLDASNVRNFIYVQIAVARDEQVGAHIKRELHHMVVRRITCSPRRLDRVWPPCGCNCHYSE